MIDDSDAATVLATMMCAGGPSSCSGKKLAARLGWRVQRCLDVLDLLRSQGLIIPVPSSAIRDWSETTWIRDWSVSLTKEKWAEVKGILDVLEVMSV